MSPNSFQLSVQYLQAGDYNRAEETLHTLIRAESGNVAARCLLGRIRLARGRPDEALALFQHAAQLDPQNAEVYNLAGSTLFQLGQPGHARNCLEEALRLNPFHAEAYNNLGKVHLLNKNEDEALGCFREAVRLQSNFIEAMHNLALMLIGRRQFDEARPLLEQVVQFAPQFAGGPLALSALYFERGDLEAALTAAEKAVQLDPQQAAAHALLGTVLLKMGRTQESLASLQTALRIAPQHVQALEHLGLALTQLNRTTEAVNCLRKAVQIDPANPRVLGNLAGLLAGQQRWEEILSFVPLLEQQPPVSADLFHNLGLAYHHLKRSTEAIAVLEQAIRLRPSAESLSVLGYAYLDAGQPEEGRACFEKALLAQPESADILAGLACAYKDLALQEQAIACYRRSLALKPNQPETHSALVFNLHYAPAVAPEQIFQEHCEWARLHAVPPSASPPTHDNEADPERRLRIGYVSADFGIHVAANYIERILQAHDRQRVEVFCYANVARTDVVTQRMQALADHWRNVFGVVDDRVEQMIRQDRIDLLIDLSGHTGGSRLTLLARKPAPVQVAHFGYMNTTGLPAVDYRLTDAYCDPPGQTERYHTEQLVRLPEMHWCYRPEIGVEANPLPAASNGYITLGMFNNFPKITPPALAAWARIMQRLPRSRLVLVANVGPKPEQRLRDAFAGHGIEASRITFVGRQGGADYFRLYHRVDLMLDPFPYTGLYTTADSLWMGVPVVTLEGSTYVTRQAASLLNRVGLHDLIARTPDEYVAKAIRLAQNLPQLKELRTTLRERLSRSPLMNPERFARQLEEAYRWMWRQWCGRVVGERGSSAPC